ncbi:hypothetical protein [Pseudosulfitobacter pseudonitzschiae]|uniref:hypothetical protein n=1 Tax=Pseudosulfitobacter pseudonitzschiae TaxID=1402135 RepID=UPI001E3EBEEE|nr:hypothetical protein [Pseudosulfitobacter pseudonitzschiae]UFF41595.1 hypothetical protein LOE11_02020 [Pseudosulfitobacter pseudonitzschiae]
MLNKTLVGVTIQDCSSGFLAFSLCTGKVRFSLTQLVQCHKFGNNNRLSSGNRQGVDLRQFIRDGQICRVCRRSNLHSGGLEN